MIDINTMVVFFQEHNGRLYTSQHTLVCLEVGAAGVPTWPPVTLHMASRSTHPSCHSELLTLPSLPLSHAQVPE